jgi:hypothetical protein
MFGYELIKKAGNGACCKNIKKLPILLFCDRKELRESDTLKIINYSVTCPRSRNNLLI